MRPSLRDATETLLVRSWPLSHSGWPQQSRLFPSLWLHSSRSDNKPIALLEVNPPHGLPITRCDARQDPLLVQPNRGARSQPYRPTPDVLEGPGSPDPCSNFRPPTSGLQSTTFTETSCMPGRGRSPSPSDKEISYVCCVRGKPLFAGPQEQSRHTNRLPTSAKNLRYKLAAHLRRRQHGRCRRPRRLATGYFRVAQI